MKQKVIAQAWIKGRRKISAFGPWISVEGLPQRVRHSVLTYKRMHERTLELGMSVQLKVRHLVLEPETANERHVWDTLVIGDAS